MSTPGTPEERLLAALSVGCECAVCLRPIVMGVEVVGGQARRLWLHEDATVTDHEARYEEESGP